MKAKVDGCRYMYIPEIPYLLVGMESRSPLRSLLKDETVVHACIDVGTPGVTPATA